MSYELWLRQQAIRLKYAGWSIRATCAHVERSRKWFSKEWKQHQAKGSGG